MKQAWIWCLVNTVLIIAFIMMYGINNEVKTELEDRVHDLEVKVNILNERKDTVIINNNINVPKDLSIIYSCK